MLGLCGNPSRGGATGPYTTGGGNVVKNGGGGGGGALLLAKLIAAVFPPVESNWEGILFDLDGFKHSGSNTLMPPLLIEKPLSLSLSKRFCTLTCSTFSAGVLVTESALSATRFTALSATKSAGTVSACRGIPPELFFRLNLFSTGLRGANPEVLIILRKCFFENL